MPRNRVSGPIAPQRIRVLTRVNGGRGHDGPGWAFPDGILDEGKFAGRAEYRYQSQVEGAALVRRAARVVFADSHDGELPDGFRRQPREPSEAFEFTTHVLPPRAFLYYCQDLCGRHRRRMR